jgi:hypothetical protein
MTGRHISWCSHHCTSSTADLLSHSRLSIVGGPSPEYQHHCVSAANIFGMFDQQGKSEASQQQQTARNGPTP